MIDLDENKLFRRTNRCDFLGPIYLGSTMDQTGILNFLNSSSSFMVAFKSGNNTADATYTWPTALPSTSSLLQSTSTGVLSWQAGISLTGVLNVTGTSPGTLSGTATTGGSLAAATYYYKVYPIFGSLVGAPTQEKSVIVGGANNAVSLSWTAVAGVTDYRVYRGVTQGGPTLYYSVGIVTAYVDTGAAGTGGGAIPLADGTWANISGNIIMPASTGGIYFRDYVDGSIQAGMAATSAGEMQFTLPANGSSAGVWRFFDQANKSLFSMERVSTHLEIGVYDSSGSLGDWDITYGTNFNFRPGNSTIATISGTAATFNNQLIGKGTATNDSAAAGYLGEYITSNQTTFQNSTGSGQFFNITSITLTAGDWDVTGVITNDLNGATLTSSGSAGAISINSGNTTTDQVQNANLINMIDPTASVDRTGDIPNYRLSLSGSTIVYLKAFLSFSAGTPRANGRISARRKR